MESRKRGLYTAKACRFCLSQDEPLASLFEKKQAPKNSIPLSLKILSSIAVEVFPSEKMPPYICGRCSFFMDVVYDFKNICREADKSILSFVQTGSALEPIIWPPSLVKLFRYGVKQTSDVNIMKVEGGATVEVSQSMSDDDEDDNGSENIYNVKIGDGSEEGTSACVKVVTSKEPEKPSKEKKRGFTSITKLTRHVRTHAGDRPYPCKHCGKTFTQLHHLTRHLRVKHSEAALASRSSLDEYRCEQCASAFQSQDELMYHSAIHATQTLTCPLCQERFPDVDAVTAHIKSHVTGMEFMCDFCELVFTSKEKLDSHIDTVHQDELRNSDEMEQDDNTSMDMDPEDEDDDDNPINVKQEGDHMVVEIKKPSEFLLTPAARDIEEKFNSTNSEESDPESPTGESIAPARAAPAPAPALPVPLVPPQMPPLTPAPASSTPSPAPASSAPSPTPSSAPLPASTPAPPKEAAKENNRTAHLVRQAEEFKRKSTPETPPPEKKDKAKVESSTGGASDKSLRLLEKELQELQRTNKREEVNKTPAKALDTARGRGRPQIHTSTPKLRSDKKETTKSTPTEKKLPERRAVKENKKPEETKTNNVSAKETKEDKETKTKEDKEIKANVSKEESKDKSAIKTNNKSASEEPVRRSSRPSKVKDYAKMVNSSPKPEEGSDDDSEDDDEEYVEPDTKPEPKPKARQVGKKTTPTPKAARAKSPPATPPATPATPAAPAPKKRGRPRKDATPAEVPAKLKKTDKVESEEKEEDSQSDKMETEDTDTSSQIKYEEESDTSQDKINTSQTTPTKAGNAEQNPNLLVQTPTGQTLKKVPIKSLPPGVKPLPFPTAARPIPNQPVTEMQIGKKMVKVQKIVMTKAEVEAMAKKGLVEMKDGTMVLKAGVKLPSDANALKSSLVTEGNKKAPKESSKPVPATPTRCEFDDA